MKKTASFILAAVIGTMLPAGVQAKAQPDVSVGTEKPAVIYAADIIPEQESSKYFVGTRINETTQEEENIGVVFVEKYNTKYVEYEISFTAEETDYYDISYYLSDGAVWKSYADVYMDGEPTRQRIQELTKTDLEYGWEGTIGNAGTIDVQNFIPKKWTAPKVLLEKGSHSLKLRFQKSMNATIYSFDRITIESSDNAVINEGNIEAEDFKWAETCNKSFPSRSFTNASAGNAVKIDSGIRAEDSETFKAVFDASEPGEYKIEIGAGAYYAGRETLSPMMVSVNGEVLGWVTEADGTGAEFVSEETPYDTSDKEISLYRFTALNTASLKKGENTISVTVFDRKDNIMDSANAGYRGYMAAFDYVKAEKLFTLDAAEAIFCGKQTELKLYDGDAEISKNEYSIDYGSSDPEIADVDANGTVTGVSEGNAVISAYMREYKTVEPVHLNSGRNVIDFTVYNRNVNPVQYNGGNTFSSMFLAAIDYIRFVNVLEPEEPEDPDAGRPDVKLTCDENGDFTILVVSDPQWYDPQFRRKYSWIRAIIKSYLSSSPEARTKRFLPAWTILSL